MQDIKQKRLAIDDIDRQLSELLERRLALVDEIATIKSQNGYLPEDPQRIAEIYSKVQAADPAYEDCLRSHLAYVLALSKSRYQPEKNKFLRLTADPSTMNDPIFSSSQRAKQDDDPHKIDATLGTLCDEEGNLLTFRCVYEIYDRLSAGAKAGYAQGIVGNRDYLAAVEKWVLPSGYERYHRSIATSGGTGALALGINTTLDPGSTVILPELAWTTYDLMAVQNGLLSANYRMFDDQGHYDITDLLRLMSEVGKRQKRLVVVINDPAHNPSGYSMSVADWEKLVDHCNSLANDIVLINDIAYLDFAGNTGNSEYMRQFVRLGDNTVVLTAFSASKTLTMYGMRLGAAIISGKPETVDGMLNACQRQARIMWSNANNGAMKTMAILADRAVPEYNNEKAGFLALLAQRAELFLSEARQCGLACYPYQAGFFASVRCADNQQVEQWQKRLVVSHIHTVAVAKGLRIALCGLPLDKIKGLALKIKEAENYENRKDR